ncbi:hypothetical protein Agub_g5998, partial [Astrephomene gubernaculifera]
MHPPQPPVLLHLFNFFHPPLWPPLLPPPLLRLLVRRPPAGFARTAHTIHSTYTHTHGCVCILMLISSYLIIPGCGAVRTTQPLDVVRTKMQADAARGVVRGALATAGVVLSEQGVRGLWAGTGPSVLRVGLGAGLHFVLLEQIRWLLSTPSPTAAGQSHLSNTGAALAGGVSRAIAAILLCPVTVVKTRMEYVSDAAVMVSRPAGTAAAAAGAAAGQAAGAAAAGAAAAVGPAGIPVYRDTFHALSTILRTEGMRGLFQGVWPTVLTNAPYSALYYMFYTRLKEGLSGEGRPQAAVNFTSGVAAAVAATLLTQPADVVRTRMQLGLGTAAAVTAAGAVAG